MIKIESKLVNHVFKINLRSVLETHCPNFASKIDPRKAKIDLGPTTLSTSAA